MKTKLGGWRRQSRRSPFLSVRAIIGDVILIGGVLVLIQEIPAMLRTSRIMRM